MCDSLDSLDVFALFFFFFTLVGLAECKKVSLVVLSDFLGQGPRKANYKEQLLTSFMKI